MKKEKNDDYTQKTIDELTSILDKEYFHVSIKMKKPNQLEWEIYYKNLPIDVYFSKKNKPILTSKKNSITDIHLLAERFKIEKQKVENENIGEIFDILIKATSASNKFRKLFLDYSTFMLMLITVLVFLNAIFLRNLWVSIVLLIFTIVEVVASNIIRDRLSIEREKMVKAIEDTYVKEKIKHLGFYFVRKIKKEQEQ